MKIILCIFLFLGSFNCYHTQSIMDTCEFSIPSSISMDCVNGNDYQFEIKCTCEFHNFELTIYNRWGKVIYLSESINHYWDASNTESGTYYWKIIGKDKNGSKTEKEGFVILNK